MPRPLPLAARSFSSVFLFTPCTFFRRKNSSRSSSSSSDRMYAIVFSILGIVGIQLLAMIHLVAEMEKGERTGGEAEDEPKTRGQGDYRCPMQLHGDHLLQRIHPPVGDLDGCRGPLCTPPTSTSSVWHPNLLHRPPPTKNTVGIAKNQGEKTISICSLWPFLVRPLTNDQGDGSPNPQLAG